MNEDEVVGLVRRVVAALEEAGVPDDLRQVAFAEVWAALGGSSGLHATASAESATQPSAAPAGALGALAKRLGVESEAVEEAFEEAEDGSLRVAVPARALPREKSTATIDLALLVCAAQQFAQAAGTPAGDIRSVCDEYGKFDSANFAATMTGRDDLWMVSRTGSNRTFKLRRGAWEQAGDVVRRLVGSQRSGG